MFRLVKKIHDETTVVGTFSEKEMMRELSNFAELGRVATKNQVNDLLNDIETHKARRHQVTLEDYDLMKKAGKNFSTLEFHQHKKHLSEIDELTKTIESKSATINKLNALSIDELVANYMHSNNLLFVEKKQESENGRK